MNKYLKNILISETENVDLPMSKKLQETQILSKEQILKETSQLNDNILNGINYYNTSIKRKPAFGLKFALTSLCLVMVMVFTVFSFFGFSNTQASALTTYIIEINPSICITTDENDDVVSACSLNDDGDELLSDTSFDEITGKNFEECLKIVVKYLIEHQYLLFKSENTKNTINFKITNNKESFAISKGNQAKEFIYEELKHYGYLDYEIENQYLPLPDFREKMGFDKDFKDLDDIRDDLISHRKYYNPDFIPNKPVETMQ